MKPPKTPFYKHDSQMPPIFPLCSEKEHEAQEILHLAVIYSLNNRNDLIEVRDGSGDPTEGFLLELNKLRKLGFRIQPDVLRELIRRVSFIRKHGWNKYRTSIIELENKRKENIAIRLRLNRGKTEDAFEGY